MGGCEESVGFIITGSVEEINKFGSYIHWQTKYWHIQYLQKIIYILHTYIYNFFKD